MTICRGFYGLAPHMAKISSRRHGMVLHSYFINKISKFYIEPRRKHEECRFTFSAMIKTLTKEEDGSKLPRK